MTKQPLVSIIMPAYNAESYIRQAIQSVLDQTYQNWELVIVDDGSSDATSKIARGFDDSRIQLHRQPNRGVAAARNLAIAKSRGTWLAFLDADDCWLPDKLEVQSRFFADYDLIFGPARYLGGPYDGRSTLELKPAIPNAYPAMMRRLVAANFIDIGSVCLRAGLCATYFDESLHFAEDYELWLRILSQRPRIKQLLQPLYRYRVHQASASSNIGEQELKAAMILRNFSRQAPAEISPLAQASAARHYGAYLSRLVGEQIRQPRGRRQPVTPDPDFPLGAKLKFKLFLYRHAPGLLDLYSNFR